MPRRLPGTAWFGAAVVLAYAVLSVVAPWLAPHAPDEVFVGGAFEPPSGDFWLGTDNLGRDVLSRVLYGGRTVLLLAGSASAISVAVGGVLGMTLGLRRGLVDLAVMRLLDIAMSVPPIIFALLLIGALGPSAPLIVAVVGLLFVPNVTRVMRAATLSVAGEDFILAARARGERRAAIVLRELLPNVAGALITEVSIRTGFAAIFISGLGFLGFGPPPPSPDWGIMINEGRSTIDASVWPVAVPAVCLALLVMSLNLFTDGVARAIDRTAR
jgi:peptide/nickel transport system permease protein